MAQSLILWKDHMVARHNAIVDSVLEKACGPSGRKYLWMLVGLV